MRWLLVPLVSSIVYLGLSVVWEAWGPGAFGWWRFLAFYLGWVVAWTLAAIVAIGENS